MWLCRLENAGLECLVTLQNLHSLNLAYTNITDPAIATLAELNGLTYLSVDSRLISDNGLQHLPSLPKLVALDIFGCKVTCPLPTRQMNAESAVSEARPDIVTESPRVQMSRIGAACVARLTSLRWLETAGGILDDHGVQALTPLAPSLTYLSLAQNKCITDKAWNSLVIFRSLCQLNLSETGMSVPKIVEVMRLPALRELSIHGVKGTQAQADDLADQLPHLNVNCRMLAKGRCQCNLHNQGWICTHEFAMTGGSCSAQVLGAGSTSSGVRDGYFSTGSYRQAWLLAEGWHLR